MSKMGRYVFDLQETANADDTDRKAHPHSQADEDPRVTAGGDGDWRQLYSANKRKRGNGNSGVKAKSQPLATWNDIPF
tara:strand:- start:4906 stop:5139 length:234 start_codon:yes stop_codon:yes gene_type:complete